eukprot:SAG11_NODE_218_length_12212_cov_7.026005_17_plen_99_part_00
MHRSTGSTAVQLYNCTVRTGTYRNLYTCTHVQLYVRNVCEYRGNMAQWSGDEVYSCMAYGPLGCRFESYYMYYDVVPILIRTKKSNVQFCVHDFRQLE